MASLPAGPQDPARTNSEPASSDPAAGVPISEIGSRSFCLDASHCFALTGSSLANLRILLLAGAIVVVMDRHVATLEHKLLQLRAALPWHSIAEWIREWYVLVALIIVAMIVVTRSHW